MAALLSTWTGSLHQTFRLLPREDQSRNLRPFLESDGATQDEILSRLPYDAARAGSGGSPSGTPDARRYRDGKQVFQTVGLLYEGADGRLRVTELGHATRRWLDMITPKNCVLLARHAAYALSACQLRNPTGAGGRYDPAMKVFPFQFIWRAMLALGGKINSEELNRAIFKVRNSEDLENAIVEIRAAREAEDPGLLGEEVIDGRAKNDRIIPWMSIASFGWTLFPDKRSAGSAGYYELAPQTIHILKEASRIQRNHREFLTEAAYTEHLSRSAALPKDLR